MSRLIDRYEEMTHSAIKPVADRFDLAIYPKVRVADAIRPESVGVTGALKHYALMAHFDFLICRDQWTPAYAIEFDGTAHSRAVQKERDAKKDRLCELAALPILRISSHHLTTDFSHLTLLGWLIEVAEMQLAFDAEQAAGRISWEEGFDPFFLMSMEPGEPKFPYWFSALPRVRLERLHKAGKLHHPVPSGFYGRDADGLYRGAELIAVTPDAGILVKGAIRNQQFPAPFGELLGEILAVRLSKKVDQWLETGTGAAPLAKVYEEASLVRAHLRSGGSSHSFGEVTDRWAV